MIGVGNDDSRYRRRLRQLAQVRIREGNWINNIEAGVGQNCAGEQVSFYEGIVILPDPKAGQKLMKIGQRHGGSVPESGSLGKRWHYRGFIDYRNYTMISFSYQARDASGRIVSGIQDALNEDNAVTSLMSRGLMVLSLQRKAASSRSSKRVWSVKETDLVLFTRQLSTMVDAGITLVE